MTAHDQLGEILKEISGEFELDDDGECPIETDAGEECVVSFLEATGQVVLSVPLVTVSDIDRFDLFQEALTINDDLTLTGSSRICFSPEQEMLVLRYATDVDGLDATALGRLIEATLQLAGEMTEHLRSTDALAKTDEVDRPSLSEGGFGPGIILA